MKIKILLAVLLVLVLAVAGFAVVTLRSPEVMLERLINDVHENGVTAVTKYCTDEVADTIDAAFAVGGIAGGILDLLPFDQSSALDTIKEYATVIEWELDDVLRSHDNADVRIRFAYPNVVSGTVDLRLTRVGGEWRISGIDAPQFSSF